MDVTEPEPLPRDHPLLELDNIIIAPHWGTATETAVRGMTKAAIDNILQGKFSLTTLFSISREPRAERFKKAIMKTIVSTSR